MARTTAVRKSDPRPILAAPLLEIASHGEKVEAAATGLLKAIREGNYRTLGEFYISTPPASA